MIDYRVRKSLFVEHVCVCLVLFFIEMIYARPLQISFIPLQSSFIPLQISFRPLQSSFRPLQSSFKSACIGKLMDEGSNDIYSNNNNNGRLPEGVREQEAQQ